MNFGVRNDEVRKQTFFEEWAWVIIPCVVAGLMIFTGAQSIHERTSTWDVIMGIVMILIPVVAILFLYGMAILLAAANRQEYPLAFLSLLRYEIARLTSNGFDIIRITAGGSRPRVVLHKNDMNDIALLVLDAPFFRSCKTRVMVCIGGEKHDITYPSDASDETKQKLIDSIL